uniref:Transmembrane protein 131-like conserved domain-containing protein n=1 Tax=Ditylenchus dipsaci TaxID=166011 RepID=A0A915DE39_9BILA
MHKLPTTLTVKRSFTIKNTGEVTFSIVNMSINNVPCENRGFRILNCHPFRLEPGEINLVDIAYTPDFLMSINEASLQIYMHMNGTPWIFDLAATIPKHMLSMCHSALPRPPFEGVMYYSCVFALLFCLICVIACSYLEGDRIITCAIRQQFVQERKVFDLNSAPPISTSSIAAIESKDNQSVITPAQRKRFGLKLPKRLRYKDYMHISPDSNLPTQFFWRSVNYVLWMFSHVWMMFREDGGVSEAAPSSSNNNNQRWARKKKAASILTPSTNGLPVENVKSKIVAGANDLVEEYLPTVKPNSKNDQKSRKLSNASGGYKSNGDMVSDFSSSFNDSSHTPSKEKIKTFSKVSSKKVVYPSEEDQSENLEMHFRLQRKLQIMDSEEVLSRANHVEIHNGVNNKGLSKNLLVEQRHQDKLETQKEEAVPKDSPNHLLRSISSSSSSVAAAKPSATHQKKSSKQKSKKGSSSSSQFSQSTGSSGSQSLSLATGPASNKQMSVEQAVLTETEKELSKSGKSSENEDISGLSDGSGVPEWAETTLPAGMAGFLR